MEITLLIMENHGSHGIVFLNFCGNPEFCSHLFYYHKTPFKTLQCFFFRANKMLDASITNTNNGDSVNVSSHT